MFCCLILGFTLESLWNPASNSLICLSHLDDFLYALSDDYMKMHFMSWERWNAVAAECILLLWQLQPSEMQFLFGAPELFIISSIDTESSAFCVLAFLLGFIMANL